MCNTSAIFSLSQNNTIPNIVLTTSEISHNLFDIFSLLLRGDFLDVTVCQLFQQDSRLFYVSNYLQGKRFIMLYSYKKILLFCLTFCGIVVNMLKISIKKL